MPLPDALYEACPFLLLLVLVAFTGTPAARATASADSTEKYWLLLADRPSTERQGPEAWTQPVAPAYLDRLRQQGIQPVVQSRWLHAVSAHLNARKRRWAARQPFVRTLRPVAMGHSATHSSTPILPWNGSSLSPSTPDSLSLGPSRGPLARMNAVAPMERGIDGRGVRIGFLDNHYRGFRHPAFRPLREDGRVIALRNFAEGRQSGSHGAGVASVTVGNAPGSVVGPAHGASVLGAMTEYVSFERNVEEDYFVAGLEWLYRRGVDVVNVSIGYNTFDEGEHSYTTEDLDGDTGVTTRAVDRAARLGVTVVVSAGNSGCADPDSCWYYVNTPADADSAITVGAIGPDSTLADFSSRGPTADGRIKPDVVVQGETVVAAWKEDGYAKVGGTSFASPQVTAVVAQMLQVNPALSPMEIRRLLRRTASQAHNPDNRKGWGVVNADAAIRAAERRARATPPPSLQIEDLKRVPTANQITLPVRVPSDVAQVTLSLQSPMGDLLATRDYAVQPGPNWLTMDVGALPPGLYWYRVHGPTHSYSGTVVLRR